MVGLEALIVPAVLAQIARLIADYGEDGVKLLCCCQDMLGIMQETLIHLDEQLRKLENNSLGSTSQKVWLSKTKKLLYDIEDILGEYYSSKKQYEESSYVDKCSMQCSRFNPLILKVSTACTMERRRGKLKAREDLRKEYIINSDSPVNFESKKQKTSDLRDEIIGRDEDFENITAMLIQDNVENIPIIPIVGPIGSGKSSLARLIFNHPETLEKFEHRVWVFVPMGSINLEEIGKDIVKQTKRETGGSEQNITNDVREVLKDERCLIVVDNLWGRDEQVNKLKQMLVTDSQTRSKVIVTTHCKRVAEMMCTVPVPYKLAALSADSCITIFSNMAAVGNDDPLFMQYGKKIVERCEGLPLVANFLGSVVNIQRQEHQIWQAVKDKAMWNLEEKFIRNDIDISEVFPSLKQIYYYMPHALKLCFVYCSIFPKGSPIDKKKLVQHWIAHRMVDSEDKDEDKKLLHAIAETYIKKLEAMSFLQVSNRKMNTAESSSNCEEVICMHNLAYDLARSVANNDIFVGDECEADTKCHDHRYARLSASNLQPGKCKKLRSLIFNTRIHDMVPLSQVISSNKYLRVLDLSECGLMALPGPIFQLSQLRYLVASKLRIKTLSEQMSSLQELKTLDLSETELEELPSLETLTKLNYLNLQGCRQLQDLTPIDKLHELHYLNVSSCTAARRLPASLENLTELRFLNLSNCPKLEEDLLESFGKLQYMEDLNLSGLGLLKLPECFGNFCSLQFLNLSFCSMLTTLNESFGNFCSLRFLNLSNCPSLEYLPESFGKLSKLEDLDLSKCTGLREPASLENLTKLRYLNLSNCSKLKELRPELLKSFGKLEYLEDLNLSGLGLLKLPECFGNFYSLQLLNLSSCSKLTTLNESFGNLRSLRSLNLSNCRSLEYLPESFGKLSKLEDLDISQCTGLRKLPRSFTSLERLCNIKSNGCQHYIEEADELHVGDKTGGANSSTIAEKKNLGKLKAHMISSSPSEADICEELKNITKVRSI